MKRLLLFSLLFAAACLAQAKPFYSYDLHGTVTGDPNGAAALSDVDIGDEFVIRLNVWARNSPDHKVAFHGVVGDWAFQQQHTSAFYIFGDDSPERFYTSGSYSPINPPAGNGSQVYPYDIYLTLYGMDETGTVNIPEDDWFVRDSGEINLDRFRSGGFHFWFFNQLHGDSYGTEEDLYGEISRIVEVPAPGSFVLVVLGLMFLGVRVMAKRAG